jgi:hypothetical protein
MKRIIGLGLVISCVLSAFAATADAAAKKKKASGTQVFGFVQTIPGVNSIRESRNIGETNILGYTDNTQKFFARQLLNSR